MKIQTILLVSISCCGFILCSSAQASTSNIDTQHHETTSSSGNYIYLPSGLYSQLTLPSDNKTSILQANVCFITDTGECRGNEFGAVNSPDAPSSSSSGGDNWEIDQNQQCWLEGYSLNTCPTLKVPYNLCPYDNGWFEKCVCNPNLVTCTKPYYGVGEDCDGKYASCALDNGKACQEDGYPLTEGCPPLQEINQKCPYDPTYYDKCVCRSDLVSCPSPLVGVGESCDGKYASCRCPSGYTDCQCGPAAGASSCTVDGVTKYDSCKPCCSDTCSRGSTSSSCPSGYSAIRVGSTECGSTCYECEADAPECSDTCSRGSKSSYCSSGYSAKRVGTTECGSTCYECEKDEPSCSDYCSRGSTSSYCSSGYSAVRVGSTECGSTCYECEPDEDDDDDYCSDYCSSGSTWVSCSSNQNKVKVGTTDCGNSCYKCEDKPCSNTCSSGSTSVSCTSKQNKVPVGKTECGNTCYKCEDKPCSNTCSSGSTSVSCKSYETKTSTGKTECGNTCYTCSHSHSYSCPSGYQTSSCSGGLEQTDYTTVKTCACGQTSSGSCYKCEKKEYCNDSCAMFRNNPKCTEVFNAHGCTGATYEPCRNMYCQEKEYCCTF